MISDKPKIGNLQTVRRLPAYLHLLKSLQSSNREFVSSTHIATALKLEPTQIRKDLALTGIAGKPKAGYSVPALIKAIEEFLCWDNTTDAFLVGAGNLGSALLGYEGFRQHGLNIIAAFDTDQTKIGTMVHDTQILDLTKLPDLAKRMHVHIGIVAVPAEYAQSAADVLVSAGIRGIWNFTPVGLEFPDDIVVQNEDLSTGLAVLSVKLAQALERDGNKQSLPFLSE
ncbi:MAG: redox-sensing transcriptional repressor Rex [Armatimonadota bacterium]